MKVSGIGPILKRLREEVLQLTLNQYAVRVGTDKATVHKYENGYLNMNLDTLEKWTRAINDKRYNMPEIVIEFLKSRYHGFQNLKIGKKTLTTGKSVV